MYRHLICVWVGMAIAVGMAGCDSGGSGPRKSMASVGKQLDAKQAADAQQDAAKAETEREAEEAQAAANQPAADKPRTEAGRAQIGEGGYLVAIAGARRHVLNSVEDLAWTQAVQHFEAEHGRLPKDHAEFMEKIVKFHGIDLGYKEEGQEFLYDPTPTEDHRWGTVYVVEAEAQTAPAQ
jgi:hypothetical protein